MRYLALPIVLIVALAAAVHRGSSANGECGGDSAESPTTSTEKKGDRLPVYVCPLWEFMYFDEEDILYYSDVYSTTDCSDPPQASFWYGFSDWPCTCNASDQTCCKPAWKMKKPFLGMPQLYSETDMLKLKMPASNLSRVLVDPKAPFIECTYTEGKNTETFNAKLFEIALDTKAAATGIGGKYDRCIYVAAETSYKLPVTTPAPPPLPSVKLKSLDSTGQKSFIYSGYFMNESKYKVPVLVVRAASPVK